MTTVNDFLNKKNTRGTYEKALSIAQNIESKRTKVFIATGVMPKKTKEEAELSALCDCLCDAYKLPKAVRDLNNNVVCFYVGLAKKYPRY